MAEAEKTRSPTPLTHIGSYRLIQPLGSGGMSSVFRAEHADSGHEVALKVLPRSLAKYGTLLQRFLREAKSAESLEHPNIVAIYDRGVEDGRYYLVLEYVPGGDLHDRVRDHGPLSVPDAVRIVRGVVAGLSYAAKLGVIHRDIKPANILVTPDGQAKLADLGLALQVEEEDERVTRDGTTVGTVDYMAPEQARDSRATSPRSDIYSLGCTFYHLLAGRAPFSGGDVPEKLRRHAFEAPPDVRAVRPDVSEPLARLIQRMMAKKPENRFNDYDQLIAAFDRIEPSGMAGDAPLVALLDDEEPAAPPRNFHDPNVPMGTTEVRPVARPLEALIDESDDGLVPLNPTTSGPSRAQVPVPTEELFALIDDDAPRPTSSSRGAQPAHQPTTRIERVETPPRTGSVPSTRSGPALNLSDLAKLDAGPVTGRSSGRKSRKSSRPLMTYDDGEAPSIEARLPVARDATPVDDGDLSAWIIRGLVVGLAVVLVGFGLIQLVNLQMVDNGEGEVEDAADQVRNTAPEPRAVPRPAPGTARPGDADLIGPPDPSPAQPDPETTYSPALETIVVPTWAARSPPVEGPTVSFQRRPLGRDTDRSESLPEAFSRDWATLEIADVGPHFAHSLPPVTRARLIRAAPGLRPSLVLGAPRSEGGEPPHAFFSLNGGDLVLEGLDLVVSLDDQPASLNALFQVGRGALVLRDCTVTVTGRTDRTFAIVHLAALGASDVTETPPRVLLDRSLVRAPGSDLIHCDAASGEVVLTRSVVLGRTALVASHAQSGSGRTESPVQLIAVHRALLALSGHLLDRALAPNEPTVQVRSLGSVFAHVSEGAIPSSLVRIATTQHLDWSGDYNVYRGWARWAAMPTEAPLLANLAAARELWPQGEAHSREQAETWPVDLAGPWADPDDLAAESPQARPTIQRVAKPTPYLHERTVGSFERLTIIPPAAPLGRVNLSFDADAMPWNGDLGRFVASQRASRGQHWVVLVQGSGTKVTAPVRPPEGVSLEVRVAPPAEGAEPLTWSPAPGATGHALLETHGADLVLANVRVSADLPTQLQSLVSVTDGRLILDHVQLTSAGSGGLQGPLVAWRTINPGARPIALGASGATQETHVPLARLVDSVLIALGDALQAELAQGVVQLEHCRVASGGVAFDLRPRGVSRARFQADLWLDHCTVVADQEFVRFGAWGNADRSPTPDRPWLISSRNTAFLDAFERGGNPRRAAALRVEPSALAHGALVWQSDKDVYAINRFLVLGDEASRVQLRPNLNLAWVELWGAPHVRRARGPEGQQPSSGPVLALSHGPVTHGAVRPEDLVLDRAIGPRDVGAEVRPVQPTLDPVPARAGPSQHKSVPIPPAKPAPRRGSRPF